MTFYFIDTFPQGGTIYSVPVVIGLCRVTVKDQYTIQSRYYTYLTSGIITTVKKNIIIIDVCCQKVNGWDMTMVTHDQARKRLTKKNEDVVRLLVTRKSLEQAVRHSMM